MHPNLFQFGRVILPTYGFLVALGAILSLLLCLRTARLLALDADKVWRLALVVTVTALAASRILSIRGESVTIAIAVATGLLYAMHLRLPLRRTADAIAPSLALAGSITSIACLEAGCGYGAPTHLPWAVIFRSRAAMPGTPLGVPLHPTQVYSSLADFVLFVLLLWLLHRPHQDGHILGVWLFLAGVSSFMLTFLRGDSGPWLAGVVTLSQLVEVAMVLAGGFLWLHDG